MIEKKANINAKNKYNETPLHLLCEFQHPNTLKLIEYFIENKAEINAQTKTDRQEKKETPLHVACKCNYKKTTQVIKFLIEKGADINAKTKNNDTPLHFACQLHKGDSLKIIQYLIKKGADINAKNKDDKTPLHFVCHNQNQRTLEFVKFLIANGADINAKTKFGKTPLHLITQFQNEYSFEIAKFLIAKGADINAKNKDGKSSFNFVQKIKKIKNQFIKQENDPKLINLMIENNANIFDLKNSKIPKEVVNSFFRNYSINQDLNNLFKLNDNFSDLQIESLDGCKFPVHKLILLTRLNNDESLLESFVKICSEKPKENVQLALNFLYTGFPNFDILTQILETLPDLESEVSKTEKIQEVETLFEKEEQKIALIQDFFKEISLDSDWIESKSKRKGILQDFTKLYEDNSTKDFKIICENKQIQVHKLILIIRSGLFKNMFLKVQDTSNQVHDYSGKSFETFKNFIYFLYHDEFDETTIIDEKLNQDLKYLKSFYQVNK
ncbi:ankyrin repeat protein [Anaeramoeba ignava]|uniref:Ankyrin repeat protein n=1 Tax=Anaeramoeba ignava TaxID=1746090 RepID=A0A9Q0RDG9_ANAIG|nr:ankyrin repeat protein [Anaeramoeba ignava]